MSANYSGLRTKTPYRMVLDAGSLIVGLNETALRSTGIAAALSTPWYWQGQLVTPRAMGATRGGAEVDPQKEERQIQVNGLRVPLISMDRVDRYTPMMKVTLLEVADVQTLAIGLGQADQEVTASGFTEVKPRIDISVTDYLPNVALLSATSEDGQVKPFIVVIRNAKVVENATLPFEDPGEVAMEVKFRGSTDIGNERTVPMSIYVPVPDDGYDGSGSGSGS